MLKKHFALCAFLPLLAHAGTIKSNSPRDLFTCRQGDIASVKAALAAGADVNSKDAEGSTPLMYAALYSNADCMRLLLGRGADPKRLVEAGAALERATSRRRGRSSRH